MEQKSMTALVSAFSRAYHSQNNKVKIFDDSIARMLLTDEEYHNISKSMTDGIGFFNPNFKGTKDEALRWVVDNQLSPPQLGRAAYAEKALQTAVSIGVKQYLIFGAGYDTFAYRQPSWAEKIQILEIDHPFTANDKQVHLKNANITIPNNVHFIEADFTNEQWQTALTQNTSFNGNKISFCSILGVAYYLSRQTFSELITVLSLILPKGSSIVFDYPDENTYTEKAGERAKKQALLAGAANEKMLGSYSYKDMEKILSEHGFLIYEHLTPMEMTQQYFETYNQANPTHYMTAFDNVNYCLAVRK
ncbi:class I SAM-dependent methyltransferase [Inediibacterium massiliense]|uniref:class I SAM-dependent methyltransferase n=1 Tax=Inediibacterium massiliense TaxID=1658111 RepID=UPI0006B43B14|nr:class I SAM-dependent methyltransferase [Inediibacterium massiliense]